MLEIILMAFAALIIGTVSSFFITKNVMLKYIETNSAVNEQVVRMMFLQSGQKVSEKKIGQVMKALEKEKNKKKKSA